MGSSIRNLLVGAIGGTIAVVIVQGIIVGVTTTSWNATVASILPYIGLSVIAAVILLIIGYIGTRSSD